jgi:DNA invertase Pin-like site-specific DNA recombinase
MDALAQFERSLMIGRTKVGIARERSRGRYLGSALSLTSSNIEHTRRLIKSGASVFNTMRALNFGRSTLYHALRAEDAPV